ncbi:tRNA pseudouridine(55) synthase TruB [Cohnella endophytica]|uniref:tRNA pseudouridine synthase B n=1 Tax=Cohnella endophytica TaxID=2419778 RepID=A0A494Y259_9BACL|nr:tRNA pseudouridine(55) synthase TruB [Cohnella endophytica]RKP55503.1 tRNA pseudouridine(55) synthase TruB [Cohnella endophytica]
MSKNKEQSWEGVLAIWKPAGWTSHDVVAKARGLLKERRIGHTGTLDPAVTGVLPLCIGRSTRFVEYLQEMPKTYRATLRFGIATDTEDLSGEVIERKDASFLTEPAMIEAALAFVGDIDQIPPMVSAVKIDGKRLYELAREGVTVERPSRRVSIYSIDVIQAVAGVEQPELTFSVTCSKGTYIRTLCVDIGRKLGVPAVMSELVRTESAGILEEHCVTLEQIPAMLASGELRKKVLSPDALLTEIPSSTAVMPESTYAVQGKAISADRLQPPPDREGILKLYRADGVFLGMFSVDENRAIVRPVKVFIAAGDHQSESPSD